MKIIGLTGDVGAGKSTLCREWEKLGAHIIDADAAARALWDAPDVRTEAEVRWGKSFFDAPRTEMYRRIADKIFTSAEEYAFAQKLIHERTIAAIKDEAKRCGGIVIAEIPLMYEGGHDRWIDRIIFAAAPFDKRVARNAKRNWNADEVARREAKLLPSEEKKRRAWLVLTNDGTEEEWKEKARTAWTKICAEAEL
ncbi:MAG: dephospho-CoA kinase [Synergistes sp.]|nr:dephospho-CoA kinase [Synergistes sp.]